MCRSTRKLHRYVTGVVEPAFWDTPRPRPLALRPSEEWIAGHLRVPVSKIALPSPPPGRLTGSPLLTN